MKAAQCRQLGSIDNLEVEDVPVPDARPGQVLIEVRAAGVNYVDAVIVEGRYQFAPKLPLIPGSELAGVVTAVGTGVERWSRGDRVVATVAAGGYAEVVAASAGDVLALPPSVDFAVGATVLQSYSTALFALTRRDGVAPGETALVLGAGGGVGLACVDVATGLGARVIAAASSIEKLAAARRAGAAETIDYSTEDLKVRARELSGGGVDIVLDPVGGQLAEPALRSLRFAGRYHVIGFAAGTIPRIALNLVLLNSRTIIGIEYGGWMQRHPELGHELAAEVFAGIQNGSLHPVTPRVMPLSEAADALRQLLGRGSTGKVALAPGR